MGTISKKKENFEDNNTAFWTLHDFLVNIKNDKNFVGLKNLKSNNIKTKNFMIDKFDIENYINIITKEEMIKNFPNGVIVAWRNNYIPEGWVLCNGENETPNLMDKMIIGSGNHKIGEIGGKETYELTIENLPKHKHNIISIADDNGNCKSKYCGFQSWNLVTDNLWTDLWNSNITIMKETGNSQSFEMLPPYYILVYIMKKYDNKKWEFNNISETIIDKTVVKQNWNDIKNVYDNVATFLKKQTKRTYTNNVNNDASWDLDLKELPEFGKKMNLETCKYTCDKYKDKCKMFSFGGDENNGNCWMKKDGDWFKTSYNNNFYRANDWKWNWWRNYTNNVNNDASWN